MARYLGLGGAFNGGGMNPGGGFQSPRAGAEQKF